jgi:hypothetical protein
MEQAKSQVRGNEDRLLSVGISIGWGETRLRELEARVAEQEAQIAALRRQVYLDEEAAEREVALLLDEGEEGKKRVCRRGSKLCRRTTWVNGSCFMGPFWE